MKSEQEIKEKIEEHRNELERIKVTDKMNVYAKSKHQATIDALKWVLAKCPS